VPAAIHVSPEAEAGGPLALLRDGDIVRLDAPAGRLEALVDAAEWRLREPARMTDAQREHNAHGVGRELFGGMRRNALEAEGGACTWL
jgi:phosphogluconate dehydratase